MRVRPFFVAVSLLFAVGCVRRADDSLALPDTDTETAGGPASIQAISWLGAPLSPRPLDADARAKLDADLAAAQADVQARPHDPQAHVWWGRRLAYLGRYDEAIHVYSEAIAKFPTHAALYRHRGHRYVTTRRLDLARADFLAAASLVTGRPDEIEPDGMPNAHNIPRSTLHGNIWYHLGLVEFLVDDLVAAEEGFRRALAAATNDDSRVAALHWLYMILRRQARHAEADAALSNVHAGMDVIENFAYLDLLRFYKGELPLTALTSDDNHGGWQNPAIAFGVANRRLVDGDPEAAFVQLREIVETSPWEAFGTIAAEADLARRNRLPEPTTSRSMPAAFDLATTFGAWIDSWQTYDLDAVDRLFLTDARLTYYSSEKPGRMQGIDAIREHHRSFGFVPGGKPAAKSLWVEQAKAEVHGDTVVVTGTWLFGERAETDPTKVQRGPLTFVYVATPDGYRIAHAHFAND